MLLFLFLRFSPFPFLPLPFPYVPPNSLLNSCSVFINCYCKLLHVWILHICVCIYKCIPKYNTLNSCTVTCVLFSGLNVEHWTSSWCDLSCRRSPLPLPALHLCRSSCRTETSWALPHLVWHVPQCHPCSAHILFSFLGSIFSFLKPFVCTECSLSFEISASLNCFCVFVTIFLRKIYKINDPNRKHLNNIAYQKWWTIVSKEFS